MPITDSRIKLLRTEAGEAGDLVQVRLCDLALAGNVSARVSCGRVILGDEARHLEDPDDK